MRSILILVVLCLIMTENKKNTTEAKRGSFGTETGYEKKKGYMPAKPTPPILNQNFEPQDITDLEVGQLIDHQRFGKGTVTSVEGEMDNRKAIIEFEEHGEKKLVLKFAKIRIVKKKK